MRLHCLALSVLLGCGGSASRTDGPVVDGGILDASTCGGGCDGGVCVGGVCCAEEQVCAGACCPTGDTCSFGKCQTPGAECYDGTECADGWYCEYTLGTEAPGQPDAGPGCESGGPRAGRCLPRPPTCPEGTSPGDPPTCLTECEVRPSSTEFAPVLRYLWGDSGAPETQDDVMMTPVVIQLDDDNCDGVVNERDTPEIVFISFRNGNYGHNGTLHAISIVGGEVVEKWSATPGGSSIHPSHQIAAGDIDGVPGNEIVVCTDDHRARAYTAAGVQKWISAGVDRCFMPQIANLDQEGAPEVILEDQVLDGATGATKFTLSPSDVNVIVADVTGDGFLDLVYANRVLDRTGATVATVEGLTGRFPAVADLNLDGVPEIIVSDFWGHALYVWHVDPSAPGGAVIDRQGVDINFGMDPGLCTHGDGRYYGGGPPTVGDFDNDGYPDVALAGGVGYAVLEGEKLMDPAVAPQDTALWTQRTTDCSSAQTGSSLFDFEGDGKAEVLYGDETTFRVYDGETGTVRFETCNTSGTLFEYPVVADVDNDGQADIVVVSNAYTGSRCPDSSKTAGVRIFSDANGRWVRTRSVWNQHPYHVTNVADDGSIPLIEAANYLDPNLNNFRLNVQPEGEFSAADLVLSALARCGSPYTLEARVTNVGSAAVPAGVPVRFYAGDPGAGGTLVGEAVTTQPLYSIESEDVVLHLDTAPPGLYDGTVALYATVAEGTHRWRECRVENNTSAPSSRDCRVN